MCFPSIKRVCVECGLLKCISLALSTSSFSFPNNKQREENCEAHVSSFQRALSSSSCALKNIFKITMLVLSLLFLHLFLLLIRQFCVASNRKPKETVKISSRKMWQQRARNGIFDPLRAFYFTKKRSSIPKSSIYFCIPAIASRQLICIHYQCWTHRWTMT